MAQTYSDKPTLEAWNAMAEAASGAGNCRVVYGTYEGNGYYGIQYPRRLEFDAKPILLFIRTEPIELNDEMFFGMRGIAWDSPWRVSEKRIIFTWYDHAVQWYSISDAASMFNKQPGTYFYVALLAADE